MIAGGTSSARPAWMIVPASTQRFDGVRDFARFLSGALAPFQHVTIITAADDREPDPAARVIAGWAELETIGAAPAVVYVNYLPQAWLRRDTLALLRSLRRLRAAGTHVIVIVHEYQIDPGLTLKRMAGRLLLRALARAFARRANVMVTTHGFVADLARADGLDRLCAIATIPVGSNLECADDHIPRRENRVVTFGQPASMSPSITAAAVGAAVEHQWDVVWCCRSAEEATAWLARHAIPAGGIRIAAGLPAHGVSRELAQATIALAPIDDGVSTRRTSVAAYLQHRLPIVGTRGRTTEPAFGDSPAFELAATDDPAAMRRAMQRVMSDGARRAAMATAARALYEAELAWPRIGERYRALTS